MQIGVARGALRRIGFASVLRRSRSSIFSARGLSVTASAQGFFARSPSVLAGAAAAAFTGVVHLAAASSPWRA